MTNGAARGTGARLLCKTLVVAGEHCAAVRCGLTPTVTGALEAG